MNLQPHLLVLGAGSAGKRHAGNLQSLGCRISLFDPRTDRVEEAGKTLTVSGGFPDLDAALAAASYDGYVIASPPAFHPSQLKKLPAGIPVLCEKPLGISWETVRDLEDLQSRVLLTYTYRWWPPVVEFRKRLLEGSIGKVRHLRFTMSAHLADWHPWEAYQDFFMSSKELGGGALLDESHFVDLLIWILGMPEKVYAQVEKISDLDISSDDNVDIVATFPDGTRATLHLDLYGRPHERSIRATGETGTLWWSYEENALKQAATGEANWINTNFQCERNEMFMAAAREYLTLLKNPQRLPSCTIKDGLAVLKVIEACRSSSEKGVAVVLA
jgi:predicted dehydrogenase